MQHKTTAKGLVVLVALVGVGALIVSQPATSTMPPSPSEETGPTLSLSDWPMPVAAQRGQKLYERYCSGCHGDQGAGDGAAATYLYPRPRNFQHGAFKFRSTPLNRDVDGYTVVGLPTVDDLVATITRGLAGSSMPSFPLFQDQQKRDLAAFVQQLAVFGAARREVAFALEEGRSFDDFMNVDFPALAKDLNHRYVDTLESIQVPVVPELPADATAREGYLDEGKQEYMRSCATCHGPEGRGDGTSSEVMRDWKDADVVPRNFLDEPFRSGSTMQDVYLRLRGGIGAPMPQFAESDEVLWKIIHYIFDLRGKAQAAKGGAR